MKPLPKPCSIFMFLLTLIVLTNIPTCLYADNSQYRTCRNLFSCGNIRDLTYPFWSENTAESCGEPDLKVTCDKGVPKFTVDSVTYRIVGWNLQSQSLTVAREDYWESSLCLKEYKNNTLDNTVFQYNDGSVVNITLLYNCNVTPPSSYIPLQDCNPGVYVAVQTMPYYSACTNVVVSFPKAQVTVVSSNNPSAIQGVLQQGIGLNWSKSYDECNRCYGSSGACGYNEGFTCFCEDGSSDKNSCPNSGSGMFLKFPISSNATKPGEKILSKLLTEFMSAIR